MFFQYNFNCFKKFGINKI